MKIIVLIGTLFFLAFLPIASKSQPAGLPDAAVAAKVGDRAISADEFLDTLIVYRKSGDMRKVLKTLSQEGKEEILNKLIEQKLYAIEAKGQGLDHEPRVRQAIQHAIDNVLAESLLKRAIDRLDLSDVGLMKFYNENAASFMSTSRVKARHINTRSKEEAQAAMKEIEKGRDFAEVAAERNIDSSKSKGGDLGWIAKGMMVKPFEDALFSLKKGQVSDIVKTSFGFHIVKAEAIDMGKLKSFEGIKEEVNVQMIDQHIRQLRKDLEKKYPVQINRELLQEIK